MAELIDMHAFEQAALAGAGGGASRAPGIAGETIGAVMEIAGSGSQILIDLSAIDALCDHDDPAIAAAGQVGSQVKMRLGTTWIVASIRSMRVTGGSGREVVAQVDFLGEGDEEKLTGKLYHFRRGVTRYPLPGCPVYPVSTADLRQIYAADNRPHVEIGTVHPSRDIRAALYVDAMLGKHFALLGSTGTGKSTSAALILHRICDLSPQGHIVMIDPHGEYGAAFAGNGAVFDINNLALPYWLMNFEEHCEVFVTSQGAERTVDSDILAKCLLAARSKNRMAESIGRLTVDSPIPYLLSDLTNILQIYNSSTHQNLGKISINTAPQIIQFIEKFLSLLLRRRPRFTAFTLIIPLSPKPRNRTYFKILLKRKIDQLHYTFWSISCTKPQQSR